MSRSGCCVPRVTVAFAPQSAGESRLDQPADAPALSVILVATDAYALIRDAVRNLTRQRDVPIELVVAGPRALEQSITADDRADLARFTGWQHVVVPDGTRFDEARARGVRARGAGARHGRIGAGRRRCGWTR